MRGFARINHNFIINVEYSKFNMDELKKRCGESNLKYITKKTKTSGLQQQCLYKGSTDLNERFKQWVSLHVAKEYHYEKFRFKSLTIQIFTGWNSKYLKICI